MRLKPLSEMGLPASHFAHADLIAVHYDPDFIARTVPVSKARLASSPAAAMATSRCMAALSGWGMLDAACPGAVFTSPVPNQMLAATKAVDGGAGVLHIVKNYTGEVMNFEMAAELAAAEGSEVAAVVTNDDVAVRIAPGQPAGAVWA